MLSMSHLKKEVRALKKIVCESVCVYIYVGNNNKTIINMFLLKMVIICQFYTQQAHRFTPAFINTLFSCMLQCCSQSPSLVKTPRQQSVHLITGTLWCHFIIVLLLWQWDKIFLSQHRDADVMPATESETQATLLNMLPLSYSVLFIICFQLHFRDWQNSFCSQLMSCFPAKQWYLVSVTVDWGEMTLSWLKVWFPNCIHAASIVLH